MTCRVRRGTLTCMAEVPGIYFDLTIDKNHVTADTSPRDALSISKFLVVPAITTVEFC